MKTLICTNCLKTVSVPDVAPGSETTCPECGKSFAVPAGYNPVVASDPVPVAPPPQSVVPPVAPPPPVPVVPKPPVIVVPPVVPPPPSGYVPPAPPPPPSAPVPVHVPSPGYTRSRGLVINPKSVAWLPAVCLTLVVFISFLFPWVASSPAGHPVHSQGLWKASFGGVNRNLQLERMMTESISWIDLVKKQFKNWELLLPALIALIVAMIVAWADRRFATLEAKQLPPPLRWTASLWSSRKLLIGGLTAFALSLITIQALSGFGMERAIKKSVADRFVDERKAAGASESAQAGIDFKQEEQVAKYAVEYTTWAYLSFVLMVVTVLAIVVRWALERRGNKPPPRLVFEY